MPKTVVSVFTTKWGHYSIGKAAEEALNPRLYKTKLNFIPVEKFTDVAYTSIYRYFPQAFKIAYKAGEIEQLTKLAFRFWESKYKKKLENAIKNQKPRVVINTYFVFNVTFEKLSVKYNFLYINIVADPRTFQKVWLTRTGHNFVFDEKARRLCLNYGIEKDKVIVSGWFVRKSFYSQKSLETIRKKLDLEINLPTYLIVGGSSGNSSILKSIPPFLLSKSSLQVVIICGDSKTLFKSAQALSNLFASTGQSIKPLGFVDNLNDYINASDVVIGKAGPNLLFETTAAKKPFIAVSHIHGQEDGNLEIIKQYKLGITEENQIKIIGLLKQVIQHPEKLNNYKKSVEKMAKYNEGSGKILEKFIEAKLKNG